MEEYGAKSPCWYVFTGLQLGDDALVKARRWTWLRLGLLIVNRSNRNAKQYGVQMFAIFISHPGTRPEQRWLLDALESVFPGCCCLSTYILLMLWRLVHDATHLHRHSPGAAAALLPFGVLT